MSIRHQIARFFHRFFKRLRHLLQRREKIFPDYVANEVDNHKVSTRQDSEKVPIFSTPEHLRIMIFTRMSSRNLCRFRQTNAKINQFISSNIIYVEQPLYRLELFFKKERKDELRYSLLPLKEDNPEVLINARNSGNFTNRKSFCGLFEEIPPCRIYSIRLADFRSATPQHWLEIMGKVRDSLTCDTLILENVTVVHYDIKTFLEFFRFSRLAVVGWLSLSHFSSLAAIPKYGEVDFTLTLNLTMPVERLTHLTRITIREASHDTAMEYLLNLLEEVGSDRDTRGVLRRFTVVFNMESKENSCLHITDFTQFELLYEGPFKKKNTPQDAFVYKIEIDEGVAYVFLLGNTYDIRFVNDGEKPSLFTIFPREMFKLHGWASAIALSTTVNEVCVRQNALSSD